MWHSLNLLGRPCATPSKIGKTCLELRNLDTQGRDFEKDQMIRSFYEIKLFVHETYEFRSTQALTQRHTHTHVSWVFLSSNSNRLRKTVQCLISRIFSLRQQKWMSWQKVFCGLLHGRTAGCSGVLNDPKNPQNHRFQSISYFFWCSACCILCVIICELDSRIFEYL